MNSLADDLVELASAPLRGGPEALAAALAPRLEAVAPHGAAELALRTPEAWRRWALSGTPVAVEELLDWLRGLREPKRVDELEELPEEAARRALAERGFRSLLACPLGGDAPGAILLYHESRWGFAGASLRRLRPLAAMAGVALAGALRLAAARSECRELRERLGERPEGPGRGRRRRRGGPATGPALSEP